jgi:hypothetical protein
MVHGWMKATPEERGANGLNLMLIGTLLGAAAFILPAIAWLVAPGSMLPGSELYGLAIVLIPLALSQAVVKKEKRLQEA